MNMPEEYTDFPIDFYNEVNDDTTVFDEAEERIRKLAKNHTDITGAMVKITKEANNRPTDYAYVATVEVFCRPNNVVANERNDNLTTALKAALGAVERQVREKREKLRNY
jgi:ribosomal subunit interface protein